jgi:RNA recognition motif-containing protein
MSERIFLGHLPQSMTQSQFDDLVLPFGAVAKTELKLGFGFVSYEIASSADAAIQALHGSTVDGNRIVCEHSRSSGPHPSRAVERRDQYRVSVEGINDSISWKVCMYVCIGTCCLGFFALDGLCFFL